MAPAASSRATTKAEALRRVFEGRTGGGGGQTRGIDVVLDRKDEAEQRLALGARGLEPRRLGEGVALGLEADEDRGIVLVAQGLKGAPDVFARGHAVSARRLITWR